MMISRTDRQPARITGSIFTVTRDRGRGMEKPASAAGREETWNIESMHSSRVGL